MRQELAELREDVLIFADGKSGNVTLDDLYRHFECLHENERERMRRVTSELCQAGQFKRILAGVYRPEQDDVHRTTPLAMLPPLDGWILNIIRTSGKIWNYRDILKRAGAAGQSVKAVPSVLRKLVYEGKLDNPRRGIYCVPGSTASAKESARASSSSAKQIQTVSEWVLDFMRKRGAPVTRRELISEIRKRGNSACALNSGIHRLKVAGKLVFPKRGVYALPGMDLTVLPVKNPPRKHSGRGQLTSGILSYVRGKSSASLENIIEAMLRSEVTESAESVHWTVKHLVKTGDLTALSFGYYAHPEKEPAMKEDAPQPVQPAKKQGGGGRKNSKLEKRLAKARTEHERACDKRKRLDEERVHALEEERRLNQVCSDLESLIREAAALEEKIATALGD